MPDSSPSALPSTEALPPAGDAGKAAKPTLVARVDLLLRLGLLGIIIVAAAIFTVKTIPSGNIQDIGQATFTSGGNLQDIARQMAVVGLIAIGETLVIITAGIDLSVGSMLGLAGILSANAYIAGWSTWLILLMVIALSLVMGLFNGFLVSAARIPPFIVTLGMLGILRGVAYLAAGGLNAALPAAGDALSLNTWVGNAFIGIPNIFWVMLIVGAAMAVLLRFTRRGRYVYALGSNPEAARLAGINVRGTLLMVYAISAILAGVAGVLLTGRLDGANPNAGLGYELDAISAAVLGGASLFGARGTIVGTLLGVVLVNMLANGIDLVNLDPHVQQVIEGALLILIVWVDQWRKRRIASS